MFDCGISTIIGELQTQFDDDCVKMVQSYGFDIDKEQLKKAITDSKSFYDEGYKDAKREYERSIGKWEIISTSEGTQFYGCSECHSAGDFWDRFCRSCGAKMENA